MAADESKVVAFPLFSHASRAVPCESSGQSLCWHTLNGNRADKELKNHAVSVKPPQMYQGDWFNSRSTSVGGARQWQCQVGQLPLKSNRTIVCPRRCFGFGTILYFRSFQILFKQVCCCSHWQLFSWLEKQSTNQSFVLINNEVVIFLCQNRKNTVTENSHRNSDKHGWDQVVVSQLSEVITLNSTYFFQSTWQTLS